MTEPATPEELEEFSRTYLDATDPLELAMTRLCDVEPERVSWLWPGRIPAGKLVTLDGDPSIGKSTLAVEFGTRVTIGGVWPDGTCCEHPGSVIVMSAEDGLADTIRPRFEAAGADLTKVHVVQGIPTVAEDGEVVLRPPTLADVSALEQAVTRIGARLLVVDVVMAYLPTGTDAHKDQDIRRVLSRLSGLADRTGCCVLLLRHLNKAAGRDPLYRGGGSIGIVGAARAGLLAAADPEDPDRRVLASVKSNLAPAPPSLAYRLIGAGNYGVARVAWEGESAHTATTLLAEPEFNGGAETKAALWLRDHLTEVPVKSSDVKEEAVRSDISVRTLQRAAKSLSVVVESKGHPRETYWSLPKSRDGRANDATSPKSGANGATTDDQPELSDPLGATVVPIAPSRQSRHSRQEKHTSATVARPVAPGGITEQTPGMSPRVLAVLANLNGKEVGGTNDPI